MLRHRSAASTRQYLSDSVRLAALAVTMSAVSSGRVDFADPGIRRPLGPGAAGGARLPLQAPLLGPQAPVKSHPGSLALGSVSLRQLLTSSATGGGQGDTRRDTSFALGSVSLRQLLTFVSHWRGAGDSDGIPIPPPVGNLATSARPLARSGADVGAGARSTRY